MTTKVQIPELGESITEAQIGPWRKQEGELVSKGETLVSLESDKAAIDLPAPVDGTLVKVVRNEGETVRVGEIIAEIDMEAAECADGAASRARDDSSQENSRPRGDQESEIRKPGPARDPSSQRAETGDPGASGGKSASTLNSKAAWTSLPDQQIHVQPRLMPAARQALNQTELTIDEVRGTGPAGRVLPQDVRRAAQMETRPGDRIASDDNSPPGSQPRDEVIIPVSPIRRLMIERFACESQSALPTTIYVEVDLFELRNLIERVSRDDLRPSAEPAIRIGMAVRAVACAMRRYPRLNSELRDGAIVDKHYVDINVGMFVDEALVAPIVRDVNTLTVKEISSRLEALRGRAEKEELTPEDLAPGTFTLIDAGPAGLMLSTPPLNPGQAATLALHAVKDQPVAGKDGMEIRPVLLLALTYDRRIVNEGAGMQFLRRVKASMEQPIQFLLGL